MTFNLLCRGFFIYVSIGKVHICSNGNADANNEFFWMYICYYFVAYYM